MEIYSYIEEKKFHFSFAAASENVDFVVFFDSYTTYLSIEAPWFQIWRQREILKSFDILGFYTEILRFLRYLKNFC